MRPAFAKMKLYHNAKKHLKGVNKMSDKKRKYPWNKSGDDSGAENEVYAGPEFFEPFERSDPSEPEEKDEPRPMEGVYAGPPVPPPFMCVYAGPEFFNGIKSQPVGAPAPVKMSTRFCAGCGALVEKGDKFCPACGAALDRENS